MIECSHPAGFAPGMNDPIVIGNLGNGRVERAADRPSPTNSPA